MRRLDKKRLFDRGTLEEEIRVGNEEIMLKKLENEKVRNEEWLIKERQEYV